MTKELELLVKKWRDDGIRLNGGADKPYSDDENSVRAFVLEHCAEELAAALAKAQEGVVVDGAPPEQPAIDLERHRYPTPYQEGYSDDGGDTWLESPDDAAFVNGLAVGDTYELQVCHYSVSRTYRVTKAPDEESDDYEVEPVALIDGTKAGPKKAQVIARPLSEWHEDDGPVCWWSFPVQEAAWVGDPNDSDWPGYHTHWTPHPPCPTTPSAAPDDTETLGGESVKAMDYTTGHCVYRKGPLGCPFHNLQCGWPNCDRRPAVAPERDGGSSE